MNQPSLALVTGATSGIGRAICHLLARKGINLLITGRDSKHLKQLQEELQFQVSVTSLVADLIIQSERDKLIALIRQEAPDLVINNAGFGLYGHCLTYTTDEQIEIVDLNANVVLELTLEAARTLVTKAKKGTIVNMSSAAAFQVLPGMSVYAASKAFVNQFSQAFNIEMEPYGIHVLSMCPGMVATHFQERAGAIKANEEIGIMTPKFVAEEVWRQIISKKPVKIIDWKYRVLTYVSKLIPTKWIALLVKKNILNRIAPRTLIKNDS